MNKVMLIGRLVRDPNVRYSQDADNIRERIKFLQNLIDGYITGDKFISIKEIVIVILLLTFVVMFLDSARKDTSFYKTAGIIVFAVFSFFLSVHLISFIAKLFF